MSLVHCDFCHTDFDETELDKRQDPLTTEPQTVDVCPCCDVAEGFHYRKEKGIEK